MPIKLDHVHQNGKHCYSVTGQYNLTECARVSLNGHYFNVAHMSYTGSYHAWNDEGKEIARFSRDLYFWFIKPFIVFDFVPDADCVPIRKTAT